MKINENMHAFALTTAGGLEQQSGKGIILRRKKYERAHL